MPESFKIQGVEIFSVGNWNGDDYTHDDLYEMVRAFDDNKVGARPHLKLGHDDKQELIQRDGMPAAGWIEKLYVVGDKLVADFSDIPKKIFELITSKAYRKVSSEIYWNIKVGEKAYKKMLAAVALLGADNPGVMNLNDILAMYKKKYGSEYDKLTVDNKLEFEIDQANLKGAIMAKTESEIKLEIDLQAKEAELKTYNQKLADAEKAQADKDAEITELKKFRADAEAKAEQAEKEKQELLANAEKAKLEKFVTELKADKLCTPAMAPLITELLGPEKKEYSLKGTDDKEVKHTKESLLKEALKLYKAAAEVNFEESSTEGDANSKNDNDDEIDKKAKEYMSKHEGVSYGQAVKIVQKGE